MNDQSHSTSIRELLAGNVQLASPPEIFLKINRILDDPNGSLAQVAYLIEHDPGLSARLLKIVNSALYHFPAPITSINQAITIIGYRELRDLVLATLIVERFSSLPNGLVSMRNFWSASVRCALLAKILADLHPERQRLHACFVCGLLHDIGRLVIYQRLPEPARAAVLLASRENIAEHEAQRRIMGFDHYAVGAELGRRWRLPEVIVVSIACHAAPDTAGEYVLPTALVILAYQLCAQNNPTSTHSVALQLHGHAVIWGLTGLQPDILDQVLPRAESEFFDVFTRIYQDR